MSTIRPQDFYQLIGESAVQFEEICYQMENCADRVLRLNGLDRKAMRQVVLSGLTADPLQRMLRALLAEHFKGKGYENILRSSFLGFENVTKERNSIIHGKWVVPIDEEQWRIDRQHVLSRRLKTSKSGDDAVFLRYSEEDFSVFINECFRLQRVFSHLSFLCSWPDLAENYFDKSTGKNI